jgi:single-stranded-DNA-specific exonuclease
MWKQRTYNKTKEAKLLENGTHKMLARLLAQRDVKEDEAESFITAEYQNISHPHELHDVEKAAQIFCDNALNNGHVSVIGDYDADGVVSAVMLKELCTTFNLKCNVFLPSRLEHGYGLNEKTIAAFSESLGTIPDLLIITDCGMNSRKEIEKLRDMGIGKIIVIDHHTGEEGSLSDNADALITWHLSNGFNEMCACGEVFQFIRGIRWITKKVNPIEFLTYAAIGTIADVSPVIGDNRIIVKNGLTQYAINHVLGAGFHAILKESKIHPSVLTQEDISFKIAPRINAVGRMHHPDVVYNLLIERDVQSAEKLANYITTYNDERKQIQSKIFYEAKKIVDSEEFSHGILVYGKGWHIGVVGIVAARIAEIYDKPTLVVGYHNDVWKGSGRSAYGINIKEILDLCPEIFEGYGGHAGAVGMTLKEDCLDKAPQIFNEACKKYLKGHPLGGTPDKYFDATLKAKAVTPNICRKILDLSPFCTEHNPEPLFYLKEVNIVEVQFVEKETWQLLKFYVEKDGFKIPYFFRTFNPPCGAEIEGRKANIVFSFPQKTKNPSNHFFSFELSVVDIELL